jgi:Rifampin ADP-ribosyl transferase
MDKIPGPFYHGTQADLAPGDLIAPGYPSPYGSGKAGRWVYMSRLIETAVLAAEIAAGDGRARVYLVASMGPFEDDPNVTDKKFPGNPTQSYRSQSPLRVVEEVTGWPPTPPERLNALRAFVERARKEGIEGID